jgi:transcription antitermination factor NusG
MPKMKMEISTPGSARNWYALFTRYQHEKSVAFSLSNKNLEVFLPLYRSVRQWRDRATPIWLPLFPCYVFIHEGMERRHQIVTTPGILRIVGWGGRAAIVPQAQLDMATRIVESRLAVEPHPYLQTGDRVRVKTGPLLGLDGILTRQKGKARLVVSMEMLGRSAAVEIDVLDVERSGPLTVSKVSARTCVSACSLIIPKAEHS